MLEYIITHMFDEFRFNFSNHKGKKRKKTHFLQLQNTFLEKNIKIVFTCDMSVERSQHVENCHFKKC